MTEKKKHEVREELRKVFEELTEEERQLLSRVVLVERGFLHQKEPRKGLVSDDLMKAVREVIK